MDARSGTVIAGFRVEGMVGAGREGTVYEATQLSLGRRVALELIGTGREIGALEAARVEQGARRQAALHHPHILPVYDAGHIVDGLFVAVRLVRGPTLAELLAVEGLEPARSRELLGQVAEGLDAAHAAGLVHGPLDLRHVVVDDRGRALVADLRPAGEGPEAVPRIAADRRAFAGLVRDHLGVELPAGGDADAVSLRALLAEPVDAGARRRRWRRPVAWGPAAIGTLAAAAALSVVAAGGDPAPDERPAPPVAAGAAPLGSALGAGPAKSADCLGRPPSINAPSCTFVQTRLRGRAVAAAGDGLIRRWAVRAAGGVVALQVLRPAGDGTFREAHRSQYAQVPGRGPHAFAAAVPVRRGDLVGMEVTPGGSLGFRPARGGTSALQWLGPLELSRAPRAPSRVVAGGAEELLLRVDVDRGARRRPVAQLTGRRAAVAPAGRVLDAEEVELAADVVVRVEVVRLADGVAIDVARAGTWRARMPVDDVDPAGRLDSLDQALPTARALRMRWLQPGDRPPVVHDYRVRPDRLELVN